MKKYNELIKIKESKDFRIKVQELGFDSFIDEISLNNVLWAELFISHRMFPEEMYREFESSEDKIKLINIMIDCDFTPSKSFVDGFIAGKNDELLKKIIVKFPTIPFDTKDLLAILNDGMIGSASSIVKFNTGLQKRDIYSLILKSKVVDNELIELIFNSSDVEYLISDLLNIASNIGLDSFSSKVIDCMFNKADKSQMQQLFSIVHDKPKENLDREVSYGFLFMFIETAPTSGGYNRERTRHVDYHVKFEALPIEMFYDKTVVSHVPKNSKLRKIFVASFPSDEDVDPSEIKELIESYKENGPTNFTFKINNKIKRVYSSFISKASLTDLMSLDLDVIENQFTPSELEGTLHWSSDQSKILYLYKNLSSKFKKRLRDKTIPKDGLPEEMQKSQKSFFMEMLTSIKSEDVESFRKYSCLNNYTLETFIKESHQTSKKNACANVRLTYSFLCKLNLVELTSLLNSSLEGTYFSNIETNDKFDFGLSKEIAYKLYYLYSDPKVLFLCENESDTVDLIKELEVDGYQLQKLVEDESNRIVSIPALNQVIRDRLMDNKLSIDEEYVDRYLLILTAEEIYPIVSHRTFLSLMRNKKDGEFLFSNEQIIEKIKIIATTDFSALEYSSFVNDLIYRDPEFAGKWIKAYLSGNKELTKLLGVTINIRRSGKEVYQSYSNIIEKGIDSLLETVLSNGAKYEDFKTVFPNYKSVIEGLPENTVVDLENISFDSVSRILYNKNYNHIKFKVSEISISLVMDGLDEYIFPNLMINKLKLSRLHYTSSDLNDSSLSLKIVEFINYYGISDIISNENDSDIENHLSLILQGTLDSKNILYKLLGSEDLVRAYVLTDSAELTEKIELDILLINYGLILSEKLIKKLISSFLGYGGPSIEYLKFIESMVGEIEGWDIVGEDLDPEDREYLNSRGFNFVSKREYKIFTLKESLIEQGPDFAVINVSLMSLDEKRNLIEFIQEKIDPRFKEINFSQVNFSVIESIENYSVMSTMVDLSEDDIVNLLNIPDNVKSNKKILKGIQDLMAINSGNFTYKVYLCKSVLDILKTPEQLTVSDFIDYSNVKDIVQSESFDKINIESMAFVERNLPILSQKFLRGKNKKQVLRFLRSCDEVSIVKDTLDMMLSVEKGREGFFETLKELNQNPEENEDQIITLRDSLNTLEQRFDEILAMDEINHIHDRLIPLQRFLREDPLQPIKTSQFSALNKKSTESELGYPLFFPQNRGDVQYMGETYGWCVNGACHYTKGVINHGNVLVGICENGSDPCKENVIALAHYIKKGSGYILEQLRWSKLKKNGSRNVSAVSSFNHKNIIDYISSYLKSKGSKG